MSRGGRILAQVLGGIVLLLAILAGLVVLATQTAPGRDVVAHIASAAASAFSGYAIEIGELRRLGLERIEIGRVRVAAGGQEIARVRDLAIAFDSGALVGGNFRPARIAAQAVDLIRLPPGEEAAAGPSAAAVPSPPFLPADEIAIQRLRLGPAIAGEPVLLSVLAREALTEAGSWRFDAEILRPDRDRDLVTLEGEYAPDRRSLRLFAHAQEGRDGLASKLLGLAGRPHLEATLDGEGPLAGWTGRFEASAAGIADTRATLRLGLGGQRISAVIDGRASVDAGFVPALPAALRQDIAYMADLAWDPETGLEIDSASLAAGESRLDLAGSLGPDLARMDLKGELRARLDALGAAFGLALDGTGRAAFEARGTLAAPQLAADLDVEEIRFADYAARRLTARVEAGLAAEGRFQASVQARAAGIAGLPEAAAPILSDGIALAFEAEGGPEAVRITQATLTGSGLEASGQGTLHLGDAPSQGRLQITLASFGPLAAAAGLPLDGRADARLEAAGALADGTFRLDGKVALSDLRSPVAGLVPALGEEADLALTLERRPDAPIRIEQAALALPAGSLRASGLVDPAGNASDVTLSAAVPALARFSALLGQPVAGSLGLQAHVTGPLADPAAQGTLRLRDAAIAETALPEANLDFAVRDLNAAPKAVLGLQAEVQGQRYRAGFEAAMPAPGRVAISGLDVTGPALKGGGNLVLRLDPLLAEGSLELTAGDLARQAELLGLPLAGEAKLDLSLAAREGRQDATVLLAGTGLRWAEMRAGGVELRAKLRDALGAEPTGEGVLTGSEATVFGTRVNRFRLAADGGLDQANFRGELDGRAGDDAWSAELAGKAGRLADGFRIGLARLNAAFATIRLRLAAPTALAVRGSVIDLAETRLAMAEGEVRVSGRIDERDAAGRLVVEGLPLDLLELFLPNRDFAGRLRIDAALAGSRAEPRLTARLRSNDLAVGADLPPIEAALDLAVGGGRATADLNLAGGADQPLTGTATIPVGFALTPFRFELPPDGRITGQVRGPIELKRILPPFLPDGDAIEGRASIALSLGGTVAAPIATGSAALRGGRYVNAMTEAVLADIALDLAADRAGMRLSASGNDGAGGTMAVQGRVDFAAGMPYPVTGELTLQNFWVARRDIASARAGADLQLRGTVAEAALRGRVEVGQAELYLPDRLPPQVVKLDVVEINGPEAARGRAGPSAPPPRRPPAEPDAASAPFVLALDLAVQADNRVFLRGRGLESEWRGDMQIRGTADEPRISGELVAINGHMSLLGKRFTLARGRFVFPGGPRIDPDLDLVAELASGDVTAQVRVGGTLSAPEINLGAQPEMPTDEVVARVLFGRGTAKLTPLQAAQVAQSAWALTQGDGGAGGIVDRVRRATGLDVLEFQSGEEGGEGAGVSVGKYIGDRVLLRAEQGISGQGPRVGLEVQVTPNISVESKVGGDASSSVGVTVKKDY